MGMFSHQHSAWISRVSMTTVHSVMTTREPTMARETPWLPVGFLPWLSLPWIQNHPFSSIFQHMVMPSIPHLSDRDKERGNNTKDRSNLGHTCSHRCANITLMSYSYHIPTPIPIYALTLIALFRLSTYTFACGTRSSLSAHPKFSAEMCVCALEGRLVGVGVNQHSTSRLVTLTAHPPVNLIIGERKLVLAGIRVNSTLLWIPHQQQNLHQL